METTHQIAMGTPDQDCHFFVICILAAENLKDLDSTLSMESPFLGVSVEKVGIEGNRLTGHYILPLPVSSGICSSLDGFPFNL